ncbi:hypothetical protein SJDPG12_08950 [Porphyromonas gingivalis SJD12]|nr:hypothetical protein SJDPG12_08950 [Porphyromonas gingivalis SJD12]
MWAWCLFRMNDHKQDWMKSYFVTLPNLIFQRSHIIMVRARKSNKKPQTERKWKEDFFSALKDFLAEMLAVGRE